LTINQLLWIINLQLIF